jgi:hypothetical protein
MGHDMLHHVELKIFFEVLHMFEFIWIWKLVWIWIWKPYRKEIENELENPVKKKKEMQPSRPNSTHLGRAPARPRRLTGGPLLSAVVPPRAPSLSRSLPSWADLSAPVFFTRALPLSLSRGPGSPVTEPLPRASPFLSLRRGPVMSVPPSSLLPWTGECALAHVAGFHGHDARPRVQLPF